MRSRCLPLALALSASLLSSPPPVWAEESGWGTAPTVARLFLPSCPEPVVDHEALLTLLRIELLGVGVELRPGVESALTFIVSAPNCQAEAVALRLEGQEGRGPSEARLDLSDRPFEERGRVLALAVAELYREASAQPPAQPEPAPAPEVQPVVDQAPVVDEAALRRLAALEVERALEARRPRPPEPEGPRRLELGASLSLRAFPVFVGAVFGGRLLLTLRPSPALPLLILLDGEYGYGGGSARRGEVNTQAAGGGVGLAVTGGTATIRGQLGARLWMGRGWTEGETTMAGVATAGASGFLLDLALTAAIRVRLHQRLRLRVGATLGYVLVGLVPLSEGREVGGIAGPSIGLDLGVDVGLL